jgi:exodeoxyribonuclease VII large subunit
MDYALEKMFFSVSKTISENKLRLDTIYSKMTALNPKEILLRGYTICADAGTGEVLRGAGDAMTAGKMKITFHDGEVLSEAKERMNDRKKTSQKF